MRVQAENSCDLAALLAVMNEKLDKIMPLRDTVLEMEASVQHMSEHFDEIMKRLDHQDKEIQCLKKRADKIDTERIVENQRELQESVHDLEWRSRRLNLEFHGISVTPNENLLEKVNQLASVLEVPSLELSDVTAIHRLPSKPDKVPGIIVRYGRQADRDAWLAKRKKLREAKKNVAILENMTKKSRELLQTTKQWASVNNFRFAWHSNGKILLRKNTGDDAIVVRSVAQLHELA